MVRLRQENMSKQVFVNGFNGSAKLSEIILTGNVNDTLSDEIVITGMSGRFPECSNVEEFETNLFSGIDMVNDDPRRWAKGLYGLPTRSGKIKDEDLQKFDSEFFNVHQKQADCMDPQMRILLELTYEAIVDAGINPKYIRGSQTGVYIGCCHSEMESYWNSKPDRINGYGLLGCRVSTFSNRLSLIFDLKGPSYTINTGSSSSLIALDRAFKDLKSGRCEAAIVGGSGLNLNPLSTLQLKTIGVLSSAGTCKTFDKNGDGYVRSDACVIIYLQRSIKAKRIYATVLNIRTNTDGYKPEGITHPDSQMQKCLMQKTYEEINLDPSVVTYLETHGTGTKVGDPQEINSITEIFCQNRKMPLMIGSVKSNMGHAEAVSGVCSLVKVLLAMETGIIPANLHYESPNPDLRPIIDGRLKVVDRNTDLTGDIIGINSFGFGGVNAHVILKSNSKVKTFRPSDESIPRLVIISGRTREGIQNTLGTTLDQRHKNNEEYFKLINEVHYKNIPLNYYRGYTILSQLDSSSEYEVEYFNQENRPIWFIYTGMGAHWASMGEELMKLDICRESIERCAITLMAEGVDLIDLLTNSDEISFDNPINAFICNATFQVVLTDLLRRLGVVPDGMVGHSVGELGCAYADGCLDSDETVLTAYWRGKCIFDTISTSMQMAAIGLSWEECAVRVPEDIFLACHNSIDSVTISGPTESITKFVKQLEKEGIFARIVKSSNIAFHSNYIKPAASKLLEILGNKIPERKRSSKWLSTSIPPNEWNTEKSQFHSVDYIVNNLLSPVWFHEAIQHIPKNAICIEIGPHGLLQGILKRSLGSDVTNISLWRRHNTNNILFLLAALGKLFTAGAEPDINKLYKPLVYPVSRGTPMLNSIVNWNHSETFVVPKLGQHESGEAIISIDLSKEEDAYLSGHTINGSIIYPASGYIYLVWNLFIKMKNYPFESTSIILENLKFHRSTILPKDGSVKLSLNFLFGSGEFEICEKDSLVVSGKIQNLHNDLPPDTTSYSLDTSEYNLKAKDIYKELKLRRYDYGGKFKSIFECNLDKIKGSLIWDNNWIVYLDAVFQFGLLDLNGLYLPTSVHKVIIVPLRHLTSDKMKSSHLPVWMNKNTGVIKTGGVEIHGIKYTVASSRGANLEQMPLLETLQFIPFDRPNMKSLKNIDVMKILIHIVLENCNGAFKIKVADLIGSRPLADCLAYDVKNIIDNEPLLVCDVTIIVNYIFGSVQQIDEDPSIRVICHNPVEQNYHVIILYDILSNADGYGILPHIKTSVRDEGFILLQENPKNYANLKRGRILEELNLIVVCVQASADYLYILLRSPTDVKLRNKEIIYAFNMTFRWIEDLKEALRIAEKENRYIYIVAQGDKYFGGVGLLKCILKENKGKYVRLIFIQDKDAMKFVFHNPFYRNQLSKDLVINVYKNSKWGSYRHLTLEIKIDEPTRQVEHAYVNTAIKGDLSSLRWFESPLSKYTPKTRDANLEFCTVYYAPINFRDIMLVSGRLSIDALPGSLAQQEYNLGLEFSGRDSSGRRIIALVQSKSLATTCLARKDMMWKIPSKWTMEQASTIPCAYSTAYYALVVRGCIKENESILIHAGAGGVGQAAISIALHYGLTVYTTVSSTKKREFLKAAFPQLIDANISNSRDTSFEQFIMNATNGKGVHLVLNSLAEDKLLASVRCLGANGRFLEIGKFDLYNNAPLGTAIFLKNISFHGILLDSIMEGDNKYIERVVSLVSDGINNGVIRPILTTVFDEKQLTEAFSFMASGKHIGKVIIKLRDEEMGTDRCTGLPRTVVAIPKTYLNANKTYIVIGGLGGFGLELIKWIISRGATNIVISSRSGIKNGYQKLMLRKWHRLGVHVVINKLNIATIEGARQLLMQSNDIAPIGGIFNLAAVLKDDILENQTEEHFKLVCEPKVNITKSLDVASRELCDQLDYFICFSSSTSGRGNFGQCNYGLANSAMDRICEFRHVAGYPATSIQWGAIGDTGMIENLGTNDTIIGGTLPQRMSSCLQIMDAYMQQSDPILASMVIPNKYRTEKLTKMSAIECVTNILGIKNSKMVSEKKTLLDLGLDSMMSSEIRQTLERNYDIVLSAQKLRQLTIAKLKSLEADLLPNGSQ